MSAFSSGRPKSERRQKIYGVHVRLTPEEFLVLQGQVEEWNQHLPQDASARARMTIPRILVAAAFRREIPRVVVAQPVLDGGVVAEMKALRIAIASSGNMLKTWLKYGDGSFIGKGSGNVLVATFPPDAGQIRSGNDLLQNMSRAHKALIALLERMPS
jgi:hypothetical protein